MTATGTRPRAETRWPRPGVPGKGCWHALAVYAALIVGTWATVLAAGVGLAKLIQAVT